jgi:hypothetical protein
MIARLNAFRENPSPRIYGNIADADPLVEYHDVDFGFDNEDDVNDAVQDMMQQAIDTNLLSAACEARLRGMMEAYRDIWAVTGGQKWPTLRRFNFNSLTKPSR